MNKIIQQAFTLIELLVVIAIIGILSGLIVVSMSGVTEKANIAKGQIFSSSLRNALMLNLVAEYKLDGSTNDSWGANNGTIVGTPAISTNCIQGSCYLFNGSTDYIYINDNDAFTFPSEFTISAWAKPIVANRNERVVYVYDATSTDGFNLLKVAKWGFILYQGGSEVQVWANNNLVTEWVNIVGTRNQSGVMKLYINGVLQTATGTLAGEINSSETVRIGADNSTVARFNGLIDEVRFYKAVVPSSQIKEQYYLGLNKLLNSGGITPKEYQSRVLDLNNRYGKR
ncbi:prepilin-type N-terminal cleavage/methylation domain-containing protein [bacterium]|jgi:prepilin-type N-terminal cleavage/methylation domain-containing protein|nr:prepilin-type N-terminal cleavage/methylation domain-containing protein [bacterium]